MHLRRVNLIFKMMRNILCLLAVIASVYSLRLSRPVCQNEVKMSISQPSIFKSVGVALLGASMLASPVLAKEGAGAKLSFFGDSDLSSPYTVSENREDPLYSQYSPFGDGSKAVYNARKNSKEEIAFWNGKFEEGM